MSFNRILVTGRAGFIGSGVVRTLIRDADTQVVNLDKLTYAGDRDSVAEARYDPRHIFEHVDIRDRLELERVFREHRPDAVMHLVVEWHVDRSLRPT